jgi:two-component system response regulator DegU
MPNTKIRLAVVDDHKLFRDGMVSLLSRYEELSVVIEASNGVELFNELLRRKRSVDVVILDVEMPEMDGVAVLKKLKDTKSEIKPLVLTMYNEDELIYRLVQFGARGLVLKGADIEDVVDAIHSLYANELYFNEDVSKRVMHKLVKKEHIRRIGISSTLSEREKEIIKLICEGLTGKEIADRLFISLRTVNKHKEFIFEKTKSKNTAGVALYAIRTGIVE